MKKLPTHIAFIMDGNRRWAKKRGLNKMLGHKKGAEVLVSVIKELNKLSENLIDREVLKNSVTFFSDYSKRTETARLEILKQKKNIDIYSKSLCDIYIDKSTGVISPEDFESISKELIVKRKTAERVIDENEKILSSIKASNKNNSDIIDEYLNPSFLTREMAEEFIDYITVGKRIQNTNEVPVEIYWNF